MGLFVRVSCRHYPVPVLHFHATQEPEPDGSSFSSLSALLSQSVYFILEYIEAGHFPIVNFQQSLSFFAWAIVGCYFLFQSKFNLRVLGSFVAPLAVVLVISSSLFPLGSLPYKPTYKSVWLPVHVISVFLGNGIFAVAFMVSVMYLLQENAIKRKKFGFFFRRLPPLDRLDALNYGVPRHRISSIEPGHDYRIHLCSDQPGSYWRWDPVEVWSLITWFMYAALLHQRLTAGWQGPTGGGHVDCGVSDPVVHGFRGWNVDERLPYVRLTGGIPVNIVLLGVNHNTAPVEIREGIASDHLGAEELLQNSPLCLRFWNACFCPPATG